MITFTVSAGGAPTFSSVAANLVGERGRSVQPVCFKQLLTRPRHLRRQRTAAWLHLNAGSGEIFGPAAGGVYTATFTVANALGSDQAMAVFVIAGAGAAPVFANDCAALAGGVGGLFNCSFDPANTTDCAASGLPPGLSYRYSRGYSLTIQGTPATAGVLPVTLTASNAAAAPARWSPSPSTRPAWRHR